MTIKRRHIRMARAAWRSNRVWMHVWWSALSKLDVIDRWHRAANGRKA